MEVHYKRFVTETKPVDHQHEVRIYADTEQKPLLDEFTITVGKELLIGNDPEINQFVKDYINSEIKELRKLADEEEGYV